MSTPQIFRLSRAMQGIGAGLVIVAGLVDAVSILSGLTSPNSSNWLGLFLFTLPFAALGIYWFWRHSGTITLTADGIVLRRFGSEQRLAYADIVAFQEKDAHLPPNYVLNSKTSVLKFSRETENFYDLHLALRQQIAVLREVEAATFPFNLNFLPGFIRNVGIWVIVIGGLLGGMLVWGLQSSANLTEDVFFIGLTAVLFLALLLAAARPRLKQKPRELIFTATEIQLLPLWGPPQVYQANQIQSIQIEEQVTSARSVRMAWIKMRVVLHPIVIKFRDGRRVIIEEGHVWQVGYSPERLLATLRQLYQPAGLGKQLLGAAYNQRNS